VTSDVSQAQPPVRLRQRALTAGVWALGAHGFDLAVSMISNLIMTRLLFPEAFGIVAAAAAPIVGLALVSDFGVNTVIVQSRRGEDDDFLRSAWVFQLLRGLLIWAILVAFCLVISIPAIHDRLPIESVYANHLFPPVTAMMGLGLVLTHVESTAVVLNHRRLNQKPIVLLGISSRILALPIMIAWAWVMPSVWALVGGSLIGGILRVIFSHTMVPGPRMALVWNRDHIREIVHFGKWIAVSSFASFISQQSDIILFGFLLPGSTLGIYAIAKLLGGAAEGVIDRLNGTLALPILGEVIRKDPENLRDRYYRFRLPIDGLAALFSGGLIATGYLVVGILYDPRYAEAGTMLQILAIGIALYPFHLIRSAFTATGDTHIVASVTIVQAMSLVACIAAGYAALGTFGAIAGVAIHRLFPSAVIMILAQKRNWISIWHELRIIPILIFGIVLGEVVVAAAKILGFGEIHHIWHR